MLKDTVLLPMQLLSMHLLIIILQFMLTGPKHLTIRILPLHIITKRM